MDIPVPRRHRGGGEGGGGLHGFLPAQNSPAPEFEQILDIPVPRGCGAQLENEVEIFKVAPKTELNSVSRAAR